MSVRGISEIVLVVRDVVVSTAFYRDVVGLSLEGEPDADWAWFLLTAEGEPTQRLALSRGPLLYEEHSPNAPGRRWGQVHFALHVDRAELSVALERVRGAGVSVFGPTRFDWMRAESWYFYDPDGNLAEFWSPDGA